jgi:hypothetical protein
LLFFSPNSQKSHYDVVYQWLNAVDILLITIKQTKHLLYLLLKSQLDIQRLSDHQDNKHFTGITFLRKKSKKSICFSCFAFFKATFKVLFLAVDKELKTVKLFFEFSLALFCFSMLYLS